mmetsp:Transcript_8583/g.18786  ORF Transcript_8583/g.18786 Transcript_8583/m.18786 type:complete len:255 (+) Transcript_8583:364-1128(+)
MVRLSSFLSHRCQCPCTSTWCDPSSYHLQQRPHFDHIEPIHDPDASQTLKGRRSPSLPQHHQRELHGTCDVVACGKFKRSSSSNSVETVASSWMLWIFQVNPHDATLRLLRLHTAKIEWPVAQVAGEEERRRCVEMRAVRILYAAAREEQQRVEVRLVPSEGKVRPCAQVGGIGDGGEDALGETEGAFAAAQAVAGGAPAVQVSPEARLVGREASGSAVPPPEVADGEVDCLRPLDRHQPVRLPAWVVGEVALV